MRFLLLLTALALAPAALAQSPPQAPRTITVSGDALVEAAPDRAVVRIGVQTDEPTAEGTLGAHEEDVQRVLTAVRRLGIADRQIEIEALSLGERWVEGGRRDGYTATRIVAVTVDDLRLVPQLVATAVAEGANRLDGLMYTLQDPDRYEDQALEEAFDRAREKAQQLATAAGGRLGGVVEVHEQGTTPPVPAMYTRAEMSMSPPMPGAYSAGTSEVRAAVVVTFSLEN